MPSIGALTKHYSKQISGLTSYFSFFRGTYNRGSSLDESSQDYNRPRRKEGTLNKSESHSWLEGAELGKLQPVKITTSGNRNRNCEMNGVGIHVEEEFYVQHEIR
jgi:hypothetical protein